jgi:hypothetical protein
VANAIAQGSGVAAGHGAVLAPLQDLPDLTGAVLETFELVLLAVLAVVVAIEVGARIVQAHRVRRRRRQDGGAESPYRRHIAGGLPTARLKARANDASDW